MKKLLALLLFITVFSCKDDVKNMPLNFDYGKIDNNVYSNNYFNFTLSLNPEWYLIPDSELNNFIDDGLDIISNENKDLKKGLDASKVNLATFFAVFKHEIGANIEFNPSISMNVENLNQFPEIITEEAYLDQGRKLLINSGLDIEYSQDVETEVINGVEFKTMKLVNKMNVYPIYQKNYCLLKNGFAINTIISYVETEDRDALIEMIQSLKFK